MSEMINELNQSYHLNLIDERFVWRYSPNQTSPQLLETISVGRASLLQNVLEKVADSASSAATHHVLIYGPQGIGKSHCLALLHHRLTTDNTLTDSVRMAWLNEEETTTSKSQFLVRIYRALCTDYPEEFSANWLNELLDQTPTEIADVLTRRLVTRFEKRKLVIMVENLDQLFDNIGTAGQHQLRTLLQENPVACLIATSPQLFNAVTNRNEPFFGFFQHIQLVPLTLTESEQMLKNIAQTKGQTDLVQFLSTPNGQSRVRALYHLIGGNPRVYVALSSLVTRRSLDQLVLLFQKMADELTPYYQEPLRAVSPLQRQILELLCREAETVNPKEIARQLLADQRSIGKQVRVLDELGYLNSTRRGRETYYELRDPLMRLAFEVKQRNGIGKLIHFLRDWYQLAETRKADDGESEVAENSATQFHHILRFSDQDSDLLAGIKSLVANGPPQISHLAVGLVKSLEKIDANRVTAVVLESYLMAVQQCVGHLPEFEIPLRLFQYGIRYLISGQETELVRLIEPERRILRQALKLSAP